MCRFAADKGSLPCPLGLLNLLISHLDLTVDHEGWEAADEVGATALSTIHEGVLHALLLEIVLLLGAPRARVRAVHSHTLAARGLVLLWRHKLIFSFLGHAGVRDVVALGAQPPLVDVKGENADDHGERHAHNDGITIHLYCTLGKKNLQLGALTIYRTWVKFFQITINR